MKLHLIYLLLFACSLAGCADSSDRSVNEPALPGQASLNDEQLTSLALEYIRANKNEYQVSKPDESLSLEYIKRDQLGAQHLKFSQHVRMVPIWGSEIVVHVKEGRVYHANGMIYPDNMVLSTAPDISQQSAEQTAAKAVAGSSTRTKSKLFILPQSLQSGKLCYLVEVSAGLKRYLMFVDANTGLIVKQIDGMPSQSGLVDRKYTVREIA